MTYFNRVEVKYGLQTNKMLLKPCALTVGNFDGVHLGHQELIKRLGAKSQSLGLPSGLMTFSPHPLKVLVPEKNIKMIFDLEEKIKSFSKFNLDFVLIEPFSRELSQLEPEDFFKKLLVDGLNVKFLIVGHDFNFGKNRKGTLDTLTDLCKKYGVQFEAMEPIKIDGEIISSTKIREAIGNGKIEKASLFLGRPFFLKGVVERGARLGHKIGFPTANLFTSGELFPKKGVYITLSEIKNKIYHSVTNVGQNPTFNEKTRHAIQIESHILDFNEDIYGEAIRVSFLHYLRDEIKFSGVSELIAQINSDVRVARGYPWPMN